MNKLIIASFFMLVVFSMSSLAVETCINTTDARNICFDVDSSIYPQNINLWEGDNNRYGLFITNPDDLQNQNLFSRIKTGVKEFFDSNKVDVTELEDDTTFQFSSYEDFYNFLQQQNAVGNVTLFTSKDLNLEERTRTRSLTNIVYNWLQIILTVILEFFKIIINLILLVASIFLFFRLIPFIMNKIKEIIFKVVSGRMNKK